MSRFFHQSATVTIPTKADCVTIAFEAKIYPAVRGCMYMANGDPGYPDEPAEVEIEAAWVLHGKRKRKIDHDELLEDEKKYEAFYIAALEAASERD